MTDTTQQNLLTITDAARDILIGMLRASRLEGFGARLKVIGRGLDGFKYDFRAAQLADSAEDDLVIGLAGLDVSIDSASLAHLRGAVIDAKPEGGLKIDNPNPALLDDLSREVATVIEQQINPGVGTHGGEITLVEVRDEVAFIVMRGGCQGCGLARVTMQQGIEKMIREAVPQIREVVDTTAHKEGERPYFPPDTLEGESALGETSP